jgi:hypothetical protein
MFDESGFFKYFDILSFRCNRIFIMDPTNLLISFGNLIDQRSRENYFFHSASLSTKLSERLTLKNDTKNELIYILVS